MAHSHSAVPVSFVSDLVKATRGDHAALARAEDALRTFAVNRAGAAGALPNDHRPDLFQPLSRSVTPLLDLTRAGSTSSSPGVAPKVTAVGNLVSSPAEGVAPAAEGSMTIGSDTFTPVPLRGYVDVTREVIDAGGTPDAQGVIAAEIAAAYDAAAEAAIASYLAGQSLTAVAFVGTGSTLANDARTEVVDLFFAAPRISAFVAGSQLFKPLATAADAAGNLLLDVEAGPSIVVGGQRILAAPAVATGGYAFEPGAIKTLISAPQSLRFERSIEKLTLGVKGYVAVSMTNGAQVRRLTYAAA